MEIEKVVNNFIEQDIESKLDQRSKVLNFASCFDRDR